MINPYRLWLAIVYDGHVSGFDDHSMQCYDCYVNLHFDNNRYNILLAAMPTDSVANKSTEESPLIPYFADNCRSAESCEESLFDNLYAYGVHMVKRYNNMYYCHRFGDRFTISNGKYMSVSVWSMEGFPTSVASVQEFLKTSYGLSPEEYDLNLPF